MPGGVAGVPPIREVPYADSAESKKPLQPKSPLIKGVRVNKIRYNEDI